MSALRRGGWPKSIHKWGAEQEKLCVVCKQGCQNQKVWRHPMLKIHIRGKTRENNYMVAAASAEKVGSLSISVDSFLERKKAFFGKTLALPFSMLPWRGLLTLGTRLPSSKLSCPVDIFCLFRLSREGKMIFSSLEMGAKFFPKQSRLFVSQVWPACSLPFLLLSIHPTPRILLRQVIVRQAAERGRETGGNFLLLTTLDGDD